MAKQHKSMRGKAINMDALRIQHEQEIALGNMSVNARGDLLGPGGKIVKDHATRVREEAGLHTMLPNKVPVVTSKEAAEKRDTDAKAKVTEKEIANKILADADIPVVDAGQKPKGGLAASIAEDEK